MFNLYIYCMYLLELLYFSFRVIGCCLSHHLIIPVHIFLNFKSWAVLTLIHVSNWIWWCSHEHRKISLISYRWKWLNCTQPVDDCLFHTICQLLYLPSLGVHWLVLPLTTYYPSLLNPGEEQNRTLSWRWGECIDPSWIITKCNTFYNS